MGRIEIPTKSPLFILLLPVIVVLLIISIPLAVTGGIVDSFFRPGRAKKMEQNIKELWVPNQKYIYLFFDEDNEAAAAFIMNKILPLCDDNAVVSAQGNWQKAAYKEAIGPIHIDVIQDFDDEYDLGLVTIGPNLKPAFHAPKYKESFVDIDEEATKRIYLKEIKKCLESWGKIK
jgi:hypothetical protein